jgi:quercetin dioxygenase-like cupin family protein
MIRVRIVKPHKKYQVGETVFVTPNEAHGLIDGGYAERTKDMTPEDYQRTKKVRRYGRSA